MWYVGAVWIFAKTSFVGGFREALQLLDEARANNLLIWIGIMVTSTLGSNIPAQLLPAADLGSLPARFSSFD